MMVFYLILTVIGSGGIAVALVNVWGKIKLKQLDLFVEERKHFISELNGLRDSMNDLYKTQYELMAENVELKHKVKELEDHVNKKSLLINELTFYKGKFMQLETIVSEFKTNNNGDILINKIIELNDVPR